MARPDAVRRRGADAAAADERRGRRVHATRWPGGSASADEHRACPAYEDVFYYLWRERRLPVERRSARQRGSTTPIERARLRARLSSRAWARWSATCCRCAPAEPATADRALGRAAAGSCATSACTWSPAIRRWASGCRSTSLPWAGRRTRDADLRARSAGRARAADAERGRAAAGGRRGAPASGADAVPPSESPRAWCAPRCASSRATAPARLHAAAGAARGVPRRWSRAIEDAAAELEQPVRSRATIRRAITRLDKLQVTPDPGVIEVNIHPARSWGELVANTTAPLRRGARSCRLGTEKFMVDGRHTGTGGGNHIVLGGPTPADSPFLRRPDLLRSLVGYWHQPPVAVLPVLGPVRRADQPGAAHRRGPPRQPLRAGDRLRRSSPAATARRRPGWSIGCSATCWSTSPATPTAPRCASTSCTARTAPAGGRAGRAARLRDAAARAHELAAAAAACARWSPGSGSGPTRAAGALGHGLVDRFTLPAFVGQDFADVHRRSARAGYALRARVVPPTRSSVFRC